MVNFWANPIAATEAAIIARLRAGMGRMLREVVSYGGELDEDIGRIISAFPAAWVTFAGIEKSTPYAASRRKIVVDGRFVVMVGDRNVRSTAASRTGGPGRYEHGTYQLVQAVRRLLTEQDMGLPIDPLRAGPVRTLFNSQINREAFSVFACEFTVRWIEEALARDYWPQPPAPGTPEAEEHPDAGFVDMGGETGPVDPDWRLTHLNYYLQPGDDVADAQDIIDKE